MMLIQPILVLLFMGGAAFYFGKFRSKFLDRAIIVALFLAATLFIMRPDLANALASVAGVGRGADLFFYISIPGLGFAVLLLLSRIRELEQRSTVLIRELALLRAENGSAKQG